MMDRERLEGALVSDAPSATVDLAEVVDSLELQSEMARYVLDRTTGKLHLLTEEDLLAAEWDEPLESLPDWQRSSLEIAREVAGGSDRYVFLPDQFEIHEYRALEGFAREHPDAEISDRLLDAIGGRGAFRRFKDAVFDLGVRDEWHEYRREFLSEIARDWCDENGVPYREDDAK